MQIESVINSGKNIYISKKKIRSDRIDVRASFDGVTHGVTNDNVVFKHKRVIFKFIYKKYGPE